jgi:hypothetical protein
MTAKQFFDWQTAGGTNDVMRLVAALEGADIVWCAIGGIAVNHWAEQPVVTEDLDFVVTTAAIEAAVDALTRAGLKAERFEWSVNFRGDSKVRLQLSTEEFYRDFAMRGVPAEVHGILLRVATLEDTLRGKIKAWSDAGRRQSKRMKDLTDIARLVEAHPSLWHALPSQLQQQIDSPQS